MKKKTASAQLSLHLHKISACVMVMRDVAERLPEDTAKTALLRLADEIKRAEEQAFDLVQTIAMHASAI
jgi:hypothetical protein